MHRNPSLYYLYSMKFFFKNKLFFLSLCCARLWMIFFLLGGGIFVGCGGMGAKILTLDRSRYNIARAKCEITSSLKPTGVVIIPAGDQLLEKTLSKNWKGRVIRVALRDDLSKFISNINSDDFLEDLSS